MTAGRASAYRVGMPKRVKHEEDDGTQSALRVVRQAVGDESFPGPVPEPSAETISAVMSLLGRRGGLKGGAARAKALSPSKRKAIAKKAAAARWGKQSP